MKRLLSVALLCAVAAGCASAPAATPVPAYDAHARGIQNWVPESFADLWETVDARIGIDYGFGASIKFTDLARIGIIDYSEFSVLGVDKGIFHLEYGLPNMEAWKQNGSWDLGFKIGIGLGCEATLRTWEVVDFFSTLLTLNYWSFDDD